MRHHRAEIKKAIKKCKGLSKFASINEVCLKSNTVSTYYYFVKLPGLRRGSREAYGYAKKYTGPDGYGYG